MPNYIVRMSRNHDLVGVYSTKDIKELADIVDECTDPSGCQYAVLPYKWGVMFESNSIPVPSRQFPEMSGTSFTQEVAGILLGDYGEWVQMPEIEGE